MERKIGHVGTEITYAYFPDTKKKGARLQEKNADGTCPVCVFLLCSSLFFFFFFVLEKYAQVVAFVPAYSEVFLPQLEFSIFSTLFK